MQGSQVHNLSRLACGHSLLVTAPFLVLDQKFQLVKCIATVFLECATLQDQLAAVLVIQTFTRELVACCCDPHVQLLCAIQECLANHGRWT